MITGRNMSHGVNKKSGGKEPENREKVVQEDGFSLSRNTSTQRTSDVPKRAVGSSNIRLGPLEYERGRRKDEWVLDTRKLALRHKMV